MKKSPTVSPLEAHLGYWLRFVSNHVSLAFARKLEERNVTVAEWVVLRELFEGSAAPSRLADRLGLTRGAITKLADRLMAKKLLTRQASEADRRGQILALTPAGRAVVPSLSALADQNDAEFFDHLSPVERATLERLMKNTIRRHRLRIVPID